LQACCEFEVFSGRGDLVAFSPASVGGDDKPSRRGR